MMEQLAEALVVAVYVAGQAIMLWILFVLVVLLTEEIGDRIYDWRHRKK